MDKALYAEWCSKPKRRRGVMLPEPMLGKINEGFRSVYLFDKEAAEEIKQSRSSKTIKRFTPHSHTLFIDLDQGDKGLARVKEWLKDNRLLAQIYTSGGKGYHIHVPHQYVCSRDLPYSHRVLVESLGAGADPSLYHVSHLIAMDGRKHPKTHRRKQLIESVQGEKELEIPLIETPPKLTFSNFENIEDNLSLGLVKLEMLISNEPGVGERHQSLWTCAKNFVDAGCAPETVMDLISKVNSRWQNAKTTEELEEVLRQAMR